MESEPGRSSALSERHRSMVEATCRTTPLSRIARPGHRVRDNSTPCSGSAVDLILDRMGVIHADTRNSIEAIHADIGAVQDDQGW